MCVNVQHERYDDGYSVIALECWDSMPLNQLWTVKRDGTIRSNGKCLTVSGFGRRSSVVINKCTTAFAGATRWQILDDGNIINPQSGLVLTADPGRRDTQLVVDNNTYASHQSWMSTMNLQQEVVSIVELNDPCMQATGNDIWLENCAPQKIDKKWALYEDGTIRPQQNPDLCISSKSVSTINYRVITLDSCGSGASPLQRWLFMENASIKNLEGGMVMDVTNSDPSRKHIIVHPFHGNMNQRWFVALI